MRTVTGAGLCSRVTFTTHSFTWLLSWHCFIIKPFYTKRFQLKWHITYTISYITVFKGFLTTAVTKCTWKLVHVAELTSWGFHLVLKALNKINSAGFQSSCRTFCVKGAELIKTFKPNSVQTWATNYPENGEKKEIASCASTQTHVKGAVRHTDPRWRRAWFVHQHASNGGSSKRLDMVPAGGRSQH